jgi:collagenase-like PrtC family protease
VASLKIEGRMKNPDYVFNVVRVWRRALDMLRDGAWDPDAVEELERELGRSFNRGFTDTYLRGRSGAELMSFERAINQGVRVGRLVAVGHEEVTVELDAAVSVLSGCRRASRCAQALAAGALPGGCRSGEARRRALQA